MNKGQEIFSESEWEPTLNPAVDICTSCISYHRKHYININAINLRWDYYEMFKAYIESKGIEVKDGQEFEIENVKINRSPIEISDCMLLDIDKKYDTGNYKFGKN